MNKNYEVLNELVPKTQELHRAIFDNGYEQGQHEVFDNIRAELESISPVRDEYSQRQNDYCDGCEFIRKQMLQILDKYKGEVDDDIQIVIKIPQYGDNTCKAQLVMTKGIFQECYKRWIEPQKGSEDMATDTRIVKALENLRNELNHINANLKCLCSIVKDLKEFKSETEVIDNSDFCKGCNYFCGSDDRRCIHGPACSRLYIYYRDHSSGNSSL